eukprot:m.37995 g.37995  ORF g.37995 m.37995 type:complete len:485 (+) comp5477_c0_seq2:15-1469(+)
MDSEELPWHHGPLSSAQAHERLQSGGMQDGLFLVCTNESGDVQLSLAARGAVHHVPLKTDPRRKGFIVNGQIFSGLSLKQLIQSFYEEENVRIGGRYVIPCQLRVGIVPDKKPAKKRPSIQGAAPDYTNIVPWGTDTAVHDYVNEANMQALEKSFKTMTPAVPGGGAQASAPGGSAQDYENIVAWGSSKDIPDHDYINSSGLDQALKNSKVYGFPGAAPVAAPVAATLRREPAPPAAAPPPPARPSLRKEPPQGDTGPVYQNTLPLYMNITTPEQQGFYDVITIPKAGDYEVVTEIPVIGSDYEYVGTPSRAPSRSATLHKLPATDSLYEDTGAVPAGARPFAGASGAKPTPPPRQASVRRLEPVALPELSRDQAIEALNSAIRTVQLRNNWLQEPFSSPKFDGVFILRLSASQGSRQIVLSYIHRGKVHHLNVHNPSPMAFSLTSPSAALQRNFVSLEEMVRFYRASNNDGLLLCTLSMHVDV